MCCSVQRTCARRCHWDLQEQFLLVMVHDGFPKMDLMLLTALVTPSHDRPAPIIMPMFMSSPTRRGLDPVKGAIGKDR